MSEVKKYKIYPKHIEEETVGKTRTEGLYVSLNGESEEEVKSKLERGEYELLYIGTFSAEHGMWSNVWYQPIEVYTSSIPKSVCEKEYNGIKLEGLCFQLKKNIAIWRREVLVNRHTQPRLFELSYLFYQFFEVVPSKS